LGVRAIVESKQRGIPGEVQLAGRNEIQQPILESASERHHAIFPSRDREGAVAALSRSSQNTYSPMRSFTSRTVLLAMGATRSAPSRRTLSRYPGSETIW